ncbi:MAG: alkene reductase, partial [Planctomycetaceae bacterium]
MNEISPHLLSPLSWDGLSLTSRVVMAPMTRGRAGKEMVANDLVATYYAQRASAGLIISEGTFTSPQAVGWAQAPGIWTDGQVEGWKKVTAAVHGRDTPIFVQLWHTGRASHPDFLDGNSPVAPSAVKLEGDPVRTTSGKNKERVTPRALDTNEIPGIVADYR